MMLTSEQQRRLDALWDKVAKRLCAEQTGVDYLAIKADRHRLDWRGMKIILEMPGPEGEWQADCSCLPAWANWIAIKRNGAVFAFENCDDEGGAGMCLRVHDERKE